MYYCRRNVPIVIDHDSSCKMCALWYSTYSTKSSVVLPTAPKKNSNRYKPLEMKMTHKLQINTQKSTVQERGRGREPKISKFKNTKQQTTV